MNRSNSLSSDPSGMAIGVIGIVASLGGVESIKRLLSSLPADFPIPTLVLQHLGRWQSNIIEILSRSSSLPVRWASQGEVLSPATVYVAPPEYSMSAHPDGTVSLIKIDDLARNNETHSGWPAADSFLASIAFSYGQGALAIVLSGMGSSGATGVREVKRQGGMVFAQDEASSYQWSMPRAAIETGCVDLILPLHEIAPVLLDIVYKGNGLPRSPQEVQSSEALFSGGGSTGALLHSIDWFRTALGRVLDWEPMLRAAVRITLASPQPQAVLWGQELIQLYNDAYSTLLGEAHPQALGGKLGDNWAEGAAVLLPLVDQVRRTGRAIEHPGQQFFIRRHGLLQQEYATFSVSPIRDEQGEIGGFLIMAQRTTDQHVSERRLHTLSELGGARVQASSPRQVYETAALVLADNRVDIPFALLYLFDETRQHALLGGSSGLPPGGPASPRSVELDSNDACCWPLEQVVRTGKAVRVDHLSERVPGTDFSEIAQTAFLLPLYTSQDMPPIGCAVLGINPRYLLDPAYRDFLDLVAWQIAQNVQAGLRIEEAHKRAEALAEVNRVKTEFFSNISHEFRTPLTLLLGPLEDLLSGTPGELSAPQHAALELAHRNSLRLLKQVNTLLDFSRLEAGRMHAYFEPVDLAALTCELLSGFRPAIERAGLRLIVDCSPLPEPVWVDAEMWEKIVLNLLSNALKFTFSGEIAVRLHARPNHIELMVRDTGIGIPKAYLPHLFERFYRVPGNRGRTSEGSGIGLALIDELVRLHQGAMRVQSQPGVGSLFTVWLPRKLRRLSEQWSETPAHSTTTGVAPFLEEASQWARDEPDRLAGQLLPSVEPLSARSPGARVLVADDNADMRDYLRRLLGQYWTVETVADGQEALVALGRGVPDLLLADVMMPNLDAPSWNWGACATGAKPNFAYWRRHPQICCIK